MRKIELFLTIGSCKLLIGRKKRIAPPPPTPRPLSSAISTQALERIVDSEESLTSDMDPSKPPSDIGAPSKANSDIDCPKANSDIAISTQSMLELGYEPKSEAATYEFDDNIQQNRTAKAETNVEACSETDSVSHKLVKADVEVIAPVEAAPKVEQARIVTKKGKLEPSRSNTLLRSFKARDPSGNPRQIRENMNDEASHATLYPGKCRFLKRDRLLTERYLQYDNSIGPNFVNNISLGIATKDHIQNVIDRKSQSLRRVPSLRENHKELISSRKFLVNRSNKICQAKHYAKEYDCTREQLKMQTSMNREDTKSNVKNMGCEISEDPWNSSSKQYAENNLSPPLLSTLQIFAISRKPLDIQMASTDSIPSDMDELPLLPMMNHTENKLEERKLSILQPPPPGLVNRQESNENWNCFLAQLNSILESRVGEFV